MWKVVTSSNLNSPLKLFFYSPILANNNLLLKIYSENIMVAFLNCHFFLYIIFPFLILSLLFSFSWFFLHHTRIPLLYIYLLFFFFFQFIPDSLFHSLALSFFTFSRTLSSMALIHHFPLSHLCSCTHDLPKYATKKYLLTHHHHHHQF